MARRVLGPNYSYLAPQLKLYSPLNLYRMRKKLYLTQEALAKLMYVKTPTYRSWESGRSPMPEIAWAFFTLRVYPKIRKLLLEKYVQIEKLETPDEW